MFSPFPGMDPWPEGHIWPDVHHDLATWIKNQLVPQVIPKYTVRIETYTPTTLSIVIAKPVEVRIPVVEIVDQEKQKLITAIEVLSPVNKRKPGLEDYRKKRKTLHEDGVHLLEIDLLRRGERPFNHPTLPRWAHYFVMLTRGGQPDMDVWAMTVRDTLPIVPVPLKSPDPDVRLDIGAALREVYDRSRYDLSVRYDAVPPPPVLSAEDMEWLQGLLKEKKGGA